MGIPTMRVNTGTWGTSKNFDELMKNRGIEPPLPGLHRRGRLRVGDRRPDRVPEDGGEVRRDAGAGEPLGPGPHAGGRAADRGRDQVAVAAGDARHRQLPRRPLRQAGEARPEDGARAGEDVLRRRAVVHARTRLRPHREDAPQAQVHRAACRWSSRARKTRRRRCRRAWRCCGRRSPEEDGT